MTYKAFLQALAGVTVAGVVTKYTLAATPHQLNTGDMPLQHVMIPGLGDEAFAEEGLYAAQNRGSIVHKGTLVVVVGPITQKTPAENLVDSVEIVDAMATGLAAIQFTVGASLPEVKVRIWPNWDVAGTDHWAVTAEVTVVA